MTKRITSVILTIAIFLTLTGCSGSGRGIGPESNKIKIVCTIFPAYDWVNNIIGSKSEKFDVELLAGGGDLHSFQPSASDILKIHTCDLFVYVGGTSDLWTEKVIKDSNIQTLKLFDCIAESEKLAVAEVNSHEHEDHSQDEYDEHIWLSLKLAKEMVNGLGKAVAKLDSSSAELYKSNAVEYIKKLDVLDEEYMNAVENSKDKTIIVADRFPFLYLSQDYQIKYVAAFLGCSSDTDADFETITRLAEAVKELKKNTVLVLENSDRTIADALRSASGVEELESKVINSCQSVGVESAEKTDSKKSERNLVPDTADYLKIMSENLTSLEAALR